jgi:hypothetical protein
VKALAALPKVERDQGLSVLATRDSAPVSTVSAPLR